jgi:hypothetical protein
VSLSEKLSFSPVESWLSAFARESGIGVASVIFNVKENKCNGINGGVSSMALMA